MKAFSKILFVARRKQNLSMSEAARLTVELAKKTNSDHRATLTQGYISRLEAGIETNPSLLKLKTLAAIYKIDPRVFFHS